MLIASTSTDKTFAVRGAEGPGSNYAHLHRVALPNGLMLHLIIAHTQRCPLKRAACNLKWKTFYCPTHISRRIGIQNRPGLLRFQNMHSPAGTHILRLILCLLLQHCCTGAMCPALCPRQPVAIHLAAPQTAALVKLTSIV